MRCGNGTDKEETFPRQAPKTASAVRRLFLNVSSRPCIHWRTGECKITLYNKQRTIRCSSRAGPKAILSLSSPTAVGLAAAYVSYLEHPLNRLAVIPNNRVLREGIRHHLITADQVLVHNHLCLTGGGRGLRESRGAVWQSVVVPDLGALQIRNLVCTAER